MDPKRPRRKKLNPIDDAREIEARAPEGQARARANAAREAKHNRERAAFLAGYTADELSDIVREHEDMRAMLVDHYGGPELFRHSGFEPVEMLRDLLKDLPPPRTWGP